MGKKKGCKREKGCKAKKGKKKKGCPQSGATTKAAMESLGELGFDIAFDGEAVETQILVVDCFAVNVAAADGDGHAAQIALFGAPHPGSEVVEAWLVFSDAPAAAGRPAYDAAAKRIRIPYPTSMYAPIEGILRNHRKRVFCHYREVQGGRRFADVHTGRVHLG